MCFFSNQIIVQKNTDTSLPWCLGLEQFTGCISTALASAKPLGSVLDSKKSFHAGGQMSNEKNSVG